MVTRKRKNRDNGYGLNLAIKLNIAILVVISLMITWSIFLVREKLLKNADEMGTYLTESYAMEEENRISVYTMLMYLGAVYADEEIENHASEEELQQWIAGYSEHMTEVLGAEIIDPYAVIDGKIIAAVPWQGDEDYDYTGTEWYQKALEADGDIIYTNAYEDAITGKQLVTIAKKLDGDGDVLAFDIFMDRFHAYENRISIPEQSSCFLFDGNGKLIYLVSDLDIEDPDTVTYAQELLDGIQNGELDSYNATIADGENQNRAVYYYQMDNGWVSVITISVDKILIEGWNSIILILVAITLALVVAIVAVLIRGYLETRRVKHTQDTLQILGDTYYAIYRINCETETYEVIKSMDDVRNELGEAGDYSHLLEVLGRVVDQDTYREFRESFSIENIRKLVEDKTGEFGGEYQRKFPDGYRWVNVRTIYSETLNLNEVILCFREIDMEKKRQIQQQILLETALENARETAREKNKFFSNVSHDMRTPLNAIIGLSDLAQKHSDERERVSEYITKIGQAGKQLLMLINEILEMSRIEYGGQKKIDYAEMNIEEFMQNVVSLFAVQAEQEKKHLEVITDVVNKVVYGDEYGLNQIFNNLMSNALKYSPEGADITLSVREAASHEKTGKYQITVKDTGYGMSKEFLKKIFEPFARETRFAPTRIAGTGLGMPIVKSFVRQMDGEITIESELGKGTEITITLPMKYVQRASDRQSASEEKEELGRQESERTEKPEDMLKGMTFLIAEDNEINMEIAVDILSMYGIKTVKAWNGREAVERFAEMPEGSIDVILMDMQMPEMDGCSAAKAIRALDRPDAKNVPIIAVTANAFAEDIARTSQAGMNGHVVKPVDFGKLVQMVTELVRQEKENGFTE